MIDEEYRKQLPAGCIVFDSPAFDNSIIGVSLDKRVIYLYEKMVEEYMKDNNCDAIEAIEFIDYNTLRAIPYAGDAAPIVLYEGDDEYGSM